jgi:nitroimidazol reductase NimA-like FMN-containing flavoprotein (pyridoxamine 5'-phosphate oxidase superfamily)
MTHTETPERAKALSGATSRTTEWDVARRRLASTTEQGRHNWLATVRPDGRPHLMPVLAFWIDDALHFVAGEGTQKGRNLAANSYCVIGTESTELPSMDVVVEGRAEPISDPEAVRTIAEQLGQSGWPLEAKGDEVFGPNAPTAGPPPYRIYRLALSKAFALPGTYGMDKFEQDELPKPTRWEFGGDGA